MVPIWSAHRPSVAAIVALYTSDEKKRVEGVPSAGSNGPYHAAPPRKERRRKKKLKLVLGSFVVCSARNNCRAIDFQKGFLPRPFPHTYMHHGALRPSRPPFVCVFHVDWKSYTILLLLFSFDSSFYRGGWEGRLCQSAGSTHGSMSGSSLIIIADDLLCFVVLCGSRSMHIAFF